ncbi:hypothetical protein [Mesorhizobium muleiense]|uniref:hypothetical protein n=1 Tax=Mesorhizobium muleiense TaxID=1004279 RepID=UPI0039B05997
MDAFKWAIHRGQLLGNTLHRINAETDAGEVLAHMPTPVFMDDSLEILAARHYANEIWMLSNFHRIMAVGEKHPNLVPAAPTKRMSVTVEVEMISSFTAYRAQHAVGRPALGAHRAN